MFDGEKRDFCLHCNFNSYSLESRIVIFCWYYMDYPKVFEVVRLQEMFDKMLIRFVELNTKVKEMKIAELPEVERWRLVEKVESESVRRGKGHKPLVVLK